MKMNLKLKERIERNSGDTMSESVGRICQNIEPDPV